MDAFLDQLFNQVLKKDHKYQDRYMIKQIITKSIKNYTKIKYYTYKVIPVKNSKLFKLIAKDDTIKHKILDSIQEYLVKRNITYENLSVVLNSSKDELVISYQIPISILILDLPLYTIIASYLDFESIIRFVEIFNLDTASFWSYLLSLKFPQLVYAAKTFDKGKVGMRLFRELCNIVEIFNSYRRYYEYSYDYLDWIGLYNSGNHVKIIDPNGPHILGFESSADCFLQGIELLNLLNRLDNQRVIQYDESDFVLEYSKLHKFILTFPLETFTYLIRSHRFTQEQINYILSTVYDINEDAFVKTKVKIILENYPLDDPNIMVIIFELIASVAGICLNISFVKEIIQVLLEFHELSEATIDLSVSYCVIEQETIGFDILDLFIEYVYVSPNDFISDLDTFKTKYNIREDLVSKVKEHYINI